MKKLFFALLFLFSLTIFVSCEKEVEEFNTNIRFTNQTSLNFDSIVVESNSSHYPLLIGILSTGDTSLYYYTGFLRDYMKISAYEDNQTHYINWKIPAFGIDATDPYLDCAPDGYYTYSIYPSNDSSNNLVLGLTSFSFHPEE